MNTFFSLIVCSVGRTSELALLFASLELQTFKHFEVILVDQNADRRLDLTVSRFGHTLPLRRIFSPIGLSRARNEGLKHVRGDVIAFPDDDCTYPPELLARISEMLRPDLDGVAVMSRDSTGAPSGPNWLCGSGMVEKLTVWRQAISYTIFIRQHCLFWVDRFDETLGVGAPTPWQAGEETDFLLRILDRGTNIFFEPALHVVHSRDSGAVRDRCRKTFKYAVGVSHVIRLHGYPLWFRTKLILGPLLRSLLAIGRVDGPGLALNVASLAGRVVGLLQTGADRPVARAALARASIIISNFNLAKFLGRAVESALQQTHTNTEVIVVDDGSTDDSLKVLQAFAGRIQVIAKENGGQASCYKAGFSQCSGDVVLFLDADDYLQPECLTRVLANWTDAVSKAHFYLTVVDGEANPIGAVVPSGRISDGAEALHMMKLFGAYCSPPASGNLFSAAFLRKILPLRNEDELVHSADAVPILAAPYFGRVLAVREALGFYRRHSDANASTRIQFDANSALGILRGEHNRDLLRDRSWRLAARQFATAPYHLMDPSRAKRRLCYLRISGGTGLVDGDTRMFVFRHGVQAVWRWSGYTFIQKAAATAWFLLVSLLPMAFACRLVKVALASGERRGVAEATL
ncbi:MAG: glycosyltransferase family 2 protein [Bryobacteraceae bacterium]